ncbi:MAG: hypothetical protein ABSG53_16030 [Thermoguttaceae bacterium]|jgi:hypothetical protein
MTKRTNATATIATAAMPTATPDSPMFTTTTGAENSAASAPADEMTDDTDAVTDNPVPAVQQNSAVGDTGPQPAVPANLANYNGINTDAYHEANVNAGRGFRFGILELLRAAGELRQIRQNLGAEFPTFARCRLGLTPTEADFLLRAAELGIDPAQFSPAVEMRLPCLMEALTTVVAAYNNTGTIDNVAPAVTNPTTTPTMTTPADAMMTIMPTANSVMMPAVPKPPVDATMTTPPPENTTAQPQVAADVVIGTTVLSGDTTVLDNTTTVLGNNTMLMPEDGSAVATVGAVELMRAELTTEQRQFLVERSVSLYLRVTKGAVTPEAALRQAKKMPVRKVHKGK